MHFYDFYTYKRMYILTGVFLWVNFLYSDRGVIQLNGYVNKNGHMVKIFVMLKTQSQGTL